MGLFLDANTAAVLAAGLTAEWEDQLVMSGRPANIGAGGDMKGAIVALLTIDPRENVLFRTSRVTSTTFDAASTYVVTINGTVHSSATPATLDAMVEALEAAINGGAQAGNVTALSVNDLDVDDPGSNTKVRIVGDNEDDYTLAVAVSGGAGTIDAVADPSTCVARIYTLDGPVAVLAANRPDRWTSSRWPKFDLTDLPVDNRGFIERLHVASLQRSYVEISDEFGTGDGIPGVNATLAYLTKVAWGPSVFVAT